MNLPDGLLPGGWLLAAWLLFVPLFLLAVRQAPWRRLADSSQLNVWLGSTVVLVLLWSMQASVRPGLALHLIGAMVCTLVFGPWLAFLSLCIALFGVSLNGGAGWQGYAANALLMAGVGVGMSRLVLLCSERFLPRHFFVYVFANGFFGAALSMAAVGLAVSLVLGASQTYAFDEIFGEYLPYVLLLSFSEAWISGMVVTLFVVYRPQWVSTFDDSRYLREK